MKILFLLCVAFCAVLAVVPPSPSCTPNPLPSIIPVTVNDSVKVDLESLFRGFNLTFSGEDSEHIKIMPKYNIHSKKLNSSYNFINAKIKEQNRFLGLTSEGDFTYLQIGVNDNTSGVTINKSIVIQTASYVYCYDVDEIFGRNKSYAVIDCAFQNNNKFFFNNFFFVDLTTYDVIIAENITDVFYDFKNINKRRIQVFYDPFNQLYYLTRFYFRDGVNSQAENNTYMELFLMQTPLNPQLLDVVDYTYLNIPYLSIVDYQVHLNTIYILNYNRGLYIIEPSGHQTLQVRNMFPIRNDMNRFRVDRLGFNDDLNLVLTNGNTVYQYEWDPDADPILKTKYTLIPNSFVEQIFVDYNYVMVLALSKLQTDIHRNVWIFSRQTTSYNNAYNVFRTAINSTIILQWVGHGSTLHIFHQYATDNVQLSLPYMKINATALQSGTMESYNISTISYYNGQSKICSLLLNLTYILYSNTSIIKTGSMLKDKIYVDSPDIREFNLDYQFFGRNLSYDVKFNINSSILPYYYVDKQHKATIIWPDSINYGDIVYFEMFTQITLDELKPQTVYGLVQTLNKTIEDTYFTSYLHCSINVMDRDNQHHLSCYVITTENFELGRIVKTSQMWNPLDRRIAVIFDKDPYLVMIYQFTSKILIYYGRLQYPLNLQNQISSVDISKNLLYVVLEFSKRVDVYRLADLQDLITNYTKIIAPIISINSRIMQFYGVNYFAPVNIKVSKYHDEVIFLKTKIGLLIMNVNEVGIPQLLYQVDTLNAQYDYEVNIDMLIIITKKQMRRYKFDIPLHRRGQFFLTHYADIDFQLGDYDQVQSDYLFYLVSTNKVYVINPFLPSFSTLFTEIITIDPIVSIEVVYIQDKQILFIQTTKNIIPWVFSQRPKLYVEWNQNQIDFQMQLRAYNPTTSSQAYNLKFGILNSTETILKPSAKFDQEAIRQLGHVNAHKNDATFTANITLNDSEWFDGTVLAYNISCPSCGSKININNHISEVSERLVADHIYDLNPTHFGIFAQQSRTLMKTFQHNDSIQFIAHIPVESRGQVCTKIVTELGNQLTVSLCENGQQVNVHITAFNSFRPFVLGPYRTQARRVNHARLKDSILMIVDNDDNPFLRAGGVYLYLLDQNQDALQELVFLDYIDYADLQIDGYQGTPYIGSADLHKPSAFQSEYKLFLTQARTGAIFIFSFQISSDREEIIYLSKSYLPLEKFIPSNILYPSPIKVLTINVISQQTTRQGFLEYKFILTVSNWHHMQLMITINQQDVVLDFQLNRLFQRFPWTLQNYVKFSKQIPNSSYFAVPYMNIENPQQIVIFYQIPELLTPVNGQVHITPVLGAHFVKDINEVSYAFDQLNEHKLLFVDEDNSNITDLLIQKQIVLKAVKVSDEEEVKLTAYNPFNNYTFSIVIDFFDEEEEQKQKLIWLIIIIVGAVMITALIIIWAKQTKDKKKYGQGHESLLTRQNDGTFKNQYINRSSEDPESIRQSIPFNNEIEQEKHHIQKLQKVDENNESQSSSSSSQQQQIQKKQPIEGENQEKEGSKQNKIEKDQLIENS